jgi:hypothetical protein
VAASPVKIHSVAEAYLLLMATPCTACGKGPLEARGHEAVDLDGTAGRKMQAACKACGQAQEFVFDLGHVEAAEAAGATGLPRINASDEPSLAIDAAQWLMLFEGIVRAADRQSDPAESRRLGYEAAQCLEEALKFYPPGDAEWPEESAFFHDWTLARFREHRHIFARTRLIELRRKLPTVTQMEQHLLAQAALKPAKRHWWTFWR